MLSQVIFVLLSLLPSWWSYWVQIPKALMAGKLNWVEHEFVHCAFVVSPGPLAGLRSNITVTLML